MDTVDTITPTEAEIRTRVGDGYGTPEDAEWLVRVLDLTRVQLALLRADNARLIGRYAPAPQQVWPTTPWPQIWCMSTSTP